MTTVGGLPVDCWDVVVIGGGIQGVGVARDAAGRGLSVLLVEQDDLAAHTSAASTKLIHGGLRYLEHHEFGLVRKALHERARLLKAAPHIMWPLRFVLPHDASMRPRWLMRAGLWMYDHLAPRGGLPRSQAVDLRTHPAGAALKPTWQTGFEYADGWVDDARLVVLCAMDARERGAQILTRCQYTGAQRVATEYGPRWRVALQDRAQPTQPGRVPPWVMARALVNAAGPWVEQVRVIAQQAASAQRMRLVQGSHVVVPALFDHDYAYVFQNPDRRVIFALPYEGRFTLIGTTELDYVGDPGQVAMSRAEATYLCHSVNRYVQRPVGPDDVVWGYAGVRPLLADCHASASAVTRDYAWSLDVQGAPILSIYGGKITTFRRMAAEVVDALQAHLGHRAPSWTAEAILPGGEMPHGDFAAWLARLYARHPQIDRALLCRLARAYGTRMQDWTSEELSGQCVPGVPVVELEYLVEQEWAWTLADVLWRRSKLGLHLSAAHQRQLAQWWLQHGPVGRG